MQTWQIIISISRQVLVFSDNCINLLDLKFLETEYEMSKDYARQLHEKVQRFKTATRTRKNVFVTLLTANGARKNEHYLSVVTNQFLIDDLFVQAG